MGNTKFQKQVFMDRQSQTSNFGKMKEIICYHNKKKKIPKQNQTKTQLFLSPALRFLNDTQGFPTLTKPAVYSGSKLQIWRNFI